MPSDFVLDGDPAQPLTPKKGAQAPIFGPCLLWACGQTAGWIKIPLGTEVGLGQGDIVLDGDPALLPKRGHSPPFLTHVYCRLVAKRLDGSRYHLVGK